MNIQDIPNRVGYRFFTCSECERDYTLLGRDRFSPSEDECPHCQDYNHPYGNCGLDEIVDHMNSRLLYGITSLTHEKYHVDSGVGSRLVSEFVDELKTFLKLTKL